MRIDYRTKRERFTETLLRCCCFVALAFGLILAGREWCHFEAVQAGHGDWITDDWGNSHFEWREP